MQKKKKTYKVTLKIKYYEEGGGGEEGKICLLRKARTGNRSSGGKHKLIARIRSAKSVND